MDGSATVGSDAELTRALAPARWGRWTLDPRACAPALLKTLCTSDPLGGRGAGGLNCQGCFLCCLQYLVADPFFFSSDALLHRQRANSFSANQRRTAFGALRTHPFSRMVGRLVLRTAHEHPAQPTNADMLGHVADSM